MIHDRRAHGLVRLPLALVFSAVAAVLSTAADTPKPTYRWEKPILWNEKDGPEAREHGSVIVDEESDRVFLIGGLGYKPEQFTPLKDVWQLSLKTDRWTRLRPTTQVPAGGSRRAAQVPGRKVAYLFGGLDNNLNNQLIQIDFSKEVPAFSEVPQDAPPAPRGLHAFAYDSKLDRFVLFGGMSGDLDAGKVVVLNDVWTMKLDDGRAKWTEVKIKGGPSPRSGFAYAYDTNGGRLIVFGGSQSARAPSNEANDTWVLHLREETPTWHQWKDGAPPARRNACFTWDQGEQRLFVVAGGVGNNQSAGWDLHVLDAKPGVQAWGMWRLAGELPQRASGSAFHDSARGRVLMGFGNSATEQYRDLYPLKYK